MILHPSGDICRCLETLGFHEVEGEELAIGIACIEAGGGRQTPPHAQAGPPQSSVAPNVTRTQDEKSW